MANNPIPEWKKAVIVGMCVKHGDSSIAKRLDISRSTVRKYRRKIEEEGTLEMDGPNLRLVQ